MNMPKIEQIEIKLVTALQSEMTRIAFLRDKLSMHNSAHVFPEFLMRRALLRARLALQQTNPKEALRMYKTLRAM